LASLSSGDENLILKKLGAKKIRWKWFPTDLYFNKQKET
jgi:hypothetical protein